MTCAAVLERHGDGSALNLRRAFKGTCAEDKAVDFCCVKAERGDVLERNLLRYT